MMTENNGANHRIQTTSLSALLAAILLTTCSESDVATNGDCRLHPTRSNEVAVIGESFIAMTHGLTAEIESRAIADGVMGPGEHYVDNSVIGTTWRHRTGAVHPQPVCAGSGGKPHQIRDYGRWRE